MGTPNKTEARDTAQAQVWRRKTALVRAIRWTGENYAEVASFCTRSDESVAVSGVMVGHVLRLFTHSGKVDVLVGDFIIKESIAEPSTIQSLSFQVCKPDLFRQIYEQPQD